MPQGVFWSAIASPGGQLDVVYPAPHFVRVLLALPRADAVYSLALQEILPNGESGIFAGKVSGQTEVGYLLLPGEYRMGWYEVGNRENANAETTFRVPETSGGDATDGVVRISLHP